MPQPHGIHGDLLSYIVIARPTSPQSNARLAYYPVHGSENTVLIEYLEANTEYNITIAAMNQFGKGKETKVIASEYERLSNKSLGFDGYLLTRQHPRTFCTLSDSFESVLSRTFTADFFLYVIICSIQFDKGKP